MVLDRIRWGYSTFLRLKIGFDTDIERLGILILENICCNWRHCLPDDYDLRSAFFFLYLSLVHIPSVIVKEKNCLLN